MNREDLDACTNRPDCPAREHVQSCPSNHRRRAVTEIRPDLLAELERLDTHGAWMVYAYNDGPAAIALYANAEGAARHAAQQGYGLVGFWRYGTEFADAVRLWEARPSPPPLAEAQVQVAYERGWRDACDDSLDQAADPSHPIGERYQQPYDPTTPPIPRKDA